MLKEYLGNSSDAFILIGAFVTVLLVSTKFCRFFTAHFLSGALGLVADLKKAGSWAVVTGCTDGIGKAYAEQLAARGLNVVLISRTLTKLEDLAKETVVTGCTDGIGKAYAEQLAARGLNVVLISRTLSKLEDLAKEIEAKSKVSTRIISVDFTRSDIYKEIESKLKDLDIGVLVNNVGMSLDFPKFFTEYDPGMTEIVLPRMVQKKTGYIINIGSAAGTSPVPLLSLYSGTKAFVDLFTQSLQEEYNDRGIVIQVVKPFFVATKMSKIRNPNLFAPSTTTFVKDALNTVGILPSTTGYWAHSIQGVFMPLVPRVLSKHVLFGLRDKGLKRKAADSKTE